MRSETYRSIIVDVMQLFESRLVSKIQSDDSFCMEDIEMNISSVASSCSVTVHPLLYLFHSLRFSSSSSSSVRSSFIRPHQDDEEESLKKESDTTQQYLSLVVIAILSIHLDISCHDLEKTRHNSKSRVVYMYQTFIHASTLLSTPFQSPLLQQSNSYILLS